MRHSRSEQFESHSHTTLSSPVGPRRWQDDAKDPNDPGALARRAAVLRAAWRGPIADRLAFLEDRCRDRKVLDVGCVAHGSEREQHDGWLHGRLARVSAECIGVDVLSQEISALNQRGYRIVDHDLAGGLGPLAVSAPFDVIVAGELIEHVETLSMLFVAASEALSTDGELILTTPNPYAPRRVWAGRRGVVWENVDHVLYAFPSGVAELAERHGLVLSEAATTDGHRGPGPPREIAKRLWRRVRGRQYTLTGFSTVGMARTSKVRTGPFASLSRLGPTHRFTGETFVYVVRRTPAAR